MGIVPILSWASHKISGLFDALFGYLVSQIYTTLLTCHAKSDKFPISPVSCQRVFKKMLWGEKLKGGKPKLYYIRRLCCEKISIAG